MNAGELRTPLGPMTARAVDRGLVLLEFADRPDLARQLERLEPHVSHESAGERADGWLQQARAEIDAYFEGDLRRFAVPTVRPGTEFQREVWDAVRRVPFGQTRSYGEVARALGRPQAARAVGSANGDNRLAIVVPCHRLLGASGSLTGYAGGVDRKRALLELERR